MLSLFSVQLYKSYGHFSELGFKIAPAHRLVEKTLIFSGKTNTAIHRLDMDVTAAAIHRLDVDVTADTRSWTKGCVNAGPLSAKSAGH